MNANELADELNGGDVSYITLDKAATMLRQQQAEIQALKGDGKVCARCGAIAYDPVITQTAKTLTDEEINQVAIDMGMFGDLSHDEIELCRNVLRKAQEK